MREPDGFIFDVRVRERLLRAGRLSPEAVDRHLAALTDRAADAEQMGHDQPALSHPDADGADGGSCAADSADEDDSSSATERSS